MNDSGIEESAQLLEELAGANIFLYAELETAWNYFLFNGEEADYAIIFSLYGKNLGLLEKLEIYPFGQTEHARIFAEQVAFCLQNRSLHDTLYDQHKDELAGKLTDAIGRLVTFFEDLHNQWDSLQEAYDPDGDPDPLETVLDLRDSVGYLLMAIQILQGKHEQYIGVPIWTYERRMLLTDAMLKVIVFIVLKNDGTDILRPTAPKDFWWRHIE